MNSLQRSVCLSTLIGLAAGFGINTSATTIDGAVINTRVFNDDPASVLTTVNTYPALVEISETRSGGGGFANLHNFHLAESGVEHAFANNEAFSFSTDLTISGAGDGEAGLQLSPWWAQNVDGRFNVRTTDGEIAVFGGRLPFYSFTGTQGLNYTKGDTVRVGFDYSPNSLSAGDPATITYNLTMATVFYTRGPITFDEGNPLEGFGSWGHLDDARVGGYAQSFSSVDNLTIQWSNSSFIPEPSTMLLTCLGALGLRMFRRRSPAALLA